MFTAEFDVVSIDKNKNQSPKKLAIYEVEINHEPIISHTFERIEAFDMLSFSQNPVFYVAHNVVIKKALAVIQNLLRIQNNALNGIAPQAKIYMAICDRQLCGIAVSNIPKITKEGTIIYSKRNHSQETELDWLATWPLKSGQKVKGVGKLLLSYVYDFVREANFESLYIRAMDPKLTNAVSFYCSMGCTKAGPLIPYESPGMPVEIDRMLDPEHKPYTGTTVPMEINSETASAIARETFNKFKPVKLADTYPNPKTIYDFYDITPKKLLLKDIFSPYSAFKKIALAISLKAI